MAKAKKKPPGWKPKSKGIEQLTIFADESYNEEHYIIGGVIAGGDQIKRVEEKWINLQDEIKEILLREYPLSWKDLKAGHPVEIKGNTLFKSTGWYRQNNSKKKHYWEQQWEWLDRAYAIGAEAGVSAFGLALPAFVERGNISGNLPLSELIEFPNFPMPKSVKEKMDRLETDRHVHLTAMMFCALGAVLEESHRMANIIWDDHALGKVISGLITPEYLRQRGVFGRLLDHSFADSKFVPMLQIADIHAYISRAGHEAQYGTAPNHYEVLLEINNRHEYEYITTPPVGMWELSLSRLLAVEMVYRGSGGPKEFQAERDAALPGIIDFLYDQFQEAAFYEERLLDEQNRKERSVVTRVQKLFRGIGARTNPPDSQ